jgi:hypothetical protein
MIIHKVSPERGTSDDLVLPGWWWGSNPPGSGFYAGRLHVLHPAQPEVALCGLPVADHAPARPGFEHLCPECCVAAMRAMYPTDAITEPRGRHRAQPAGTAARTEPLPVVHDQVGHDDAVPGDTDP